MMRGAAALAAVWMAACAPEQLAPPRPSFTITGTYSNIRYVEEAGDLVGEEIVIKDNPDGEYRAELVMAVGSRGEKVIVPVTYEADRDCHRVTIETGPPYNAHFTGCVGAQALVGTFRFRYGNTLDVYLFRKP